MTNAAQTITTSTAALNSASVINPASAINNAIANDTARTLVTLLQLGRRARAAKTVETLGFVMVNETLQLLNYRQAGLWLRSAGLRSAGFGHAVESAGLATGLGYIGAVSGTPNPDPNAPYIQWLTHISRHLDKTKHYSAQTIAYPICAADVPEVLAADWSHWLPLHGLWVPLADGLNHNGGLFFARPEPWSPAELALMAEWVPVYQHALQALNPRHPWQFNLREWFKPNRTKLWVAAIILAIGLFPVRLSVLAPAEVIPQNPFLVRAPLDGVIEKFYVRPNQAVTPGTPLFSLDITVLQSQHAVAQQAYDTAQEEYRQAAQLAVTDDKSKFEMALRRGVLAEKSVELDYSAEQLGRVQVKAERAGVAVFNDINDWQGKAVTLGEKIILLADPALVELNIDLPASDIMAIEPGAEVTLYPNASPVSSYRAKVLTVAYSAQPTTQNVLAYRIKAQFTAGQEVPRLGMMGTAKISGGYVPFSYYLLRKPLAATRQWLGW